ncbi:GreA/GreB family elongation factor [Christiangramia forsetii]|uniref:GreA-like transcription elongation factor n=2 Tax=Christiangramia forsetii TaxID=411153 RepID=A0M1N1_CHRFK|nr:GreA/GreB family elongation factor [Christiangramia forsetii]GGG42118.1 transcription elongation factor GreB [Christiangramia forsetii]CAL66526.1 GreA-like transcription elongation factor [Christiangramia forsetii KT0803]
MSRGFVKEEDQEEPVLVPPRAAIPEGVTNYVTPNGLAELKQELKDLEYERAHVEAENDTEKRRAQSLIDGKINLLSERLQTARLLDSKDQPKDEIRFGARVKLTNETSGQLQEFQIVGVDEADIKKKKIAFVAPIAKAVTGRKVGEEIDFKLGNEIRKLKVLGITY